MKALFLALAVLALVGCETMPQQQPDPRVSEFFEWRTAARKQAEAGQMKWSDYYTQSYDRIAELPNDPLAALDMQILSEMIPVARKFESGEITAEQFDDARRAARAKIRQATADLQRSDAEARRAAAIQMLANQPRIQPNTVPTYQMPVPQRRRHTNCTSYVSGGQLITNCQ